MLLAIWIEAIFYQIYTIKKLLVPKLTQDLVVAQAILV